MTKKDYIIIAEAVRDTTQHFYSAGGLTDDQTEFYTVLRAKMSARFSADNPRFDYAKFRDFISK